MAEAAKMVEGLGFDIVDLNLGCPAKKVVKCNGGSGLLRDLPAIGRIFEAVRAAVKVPFTVKFRAGWSDDEIVCVELARMAEACGLAAVALHARTREQGYSGQARWEWIAAIKDAVKIPVIGNGDIRDSRRRLRHGRANRMRRRHDRPHRPVQPLDLPPDRTILRDGALR